MFNGCWVTALDSLEIVAIVPVVIDSLKPMMLCSNKHDKFLNKIIHAKTEK